MQRRSPAEQSVTPPVSIAITCTKYVPGESRLLVSHLTTPAADGGSLIASDSRTFLDSSAPPGPSALLAAATNATGLTSLTSIRTTTCRFAATAERRIGKEPAHESPAPTKTNNATTEATGRFLAIAGS